MFRSVNNPFVSTRTNSVWWAPPFDVPEKCKDLETYKKAADHLVFGKIDEDGGSWKYSGAK